jgi:hypothetical protein
LVYREGVLAWGWINKRVQYYTKTFSNKHLLTDALGELPARTVLRKEQWERKGGKQALLPEQSLFLKPTK